MSYEDRIHEEMEAFMAIAREGTERFPVRPGEVEECVFLGTLHTETDVDVAGFTVERDGGKIRIDEMHLQVLGWATSKKRGRITLRHPLLVDPSMFVWEPE